MEMDKDVVTSIFKIFGIIGEIVKLDKIKGHERKKKLLALRRKKYEEKKDKYVKEIKEYAKHRDELVIKLKKEGILLCNSKDLSRINGKLRDLHILRTCTVWAIQMEEVMIDVKL